MTLVVALTNMREAVLIADSLCMSQCEGVWYQEPREYRKIHKTINPNFVVGIAGNTQAIALLEQIKDEQRTAHRKGELETFESVVRSTHKWLTKKYTDSDICWGSPVEFLFVGFEKKPKIYLVRCSEEGASHKVVSPIYPCDQYKAIGASRHGALYVLYESLKTENLTTEQLISIGSYALYSTAQHEVSVDARLHIVVVKEGKVEYHSMPKEGLIALKDRVAQVGNLISSPLPVTTDMQPPRS